MMEAQTIEAEKTSVDSSDEATKTSLDSDEATTTLLSVPDSKPQITKTDSELKTILDDKITAVYAGYVSLLTSFIKGERVDTDKLVELIFALGKIVEVEMDIRLLRGYFDFQDKKEERAKASIRLKEIKTELEEGQTELLEMLQQAEQNELRASAALGPYAPESPNCSDIESLQRVVDRRMAKLRYEERQLQIITNVNSQLPPAHVLWKRFRIKGTGG